MYNRVAQIQKFFKKFEKIVTLCCIIIFSINYWFKFDRPQFFNVRNPDNVFGMTRFYCYIQFCFRVFFKVQTGN